MDQEKSERQDMLPGESQPLRGKEKIYEHFRGVPLKALDVFIGLCIAAFIAVVVIGVLQGSRFR